MRNGKAVFLKARKEKAKGKQNRKFRLFLCKRLAAIAPYTTFLLRLCTSQIAGQYS